MKVIWGVICRDASTDQRTNNISLFHVLEETHVPEPPERRSDEEPLPVAPIQFLLVVLFGRSDIRQPEQRKARTILSFPDGHDHEDIMDLEVDLNSAPRNRTTLEIIGLPIRGEGTYHFRIEVVDENAEWHQLFEMPLQVFYQPQD